MMRLYHQELQSQIVLSEDFPAVVTVESPNLFYRLISNLWCQTQNQPTNSEFTLDLNYKALNISKELDLVLNPLLLDFKQRKILNKIFLEFDRLAAEPENIEETAKLHTVLEKYFSRISINYPVPLKWSDNILMSNIAKALELAIDVDELDLVQQLLTYMQLLTSLRVTSVFSFVHLKSFLNDRQLSDLYHESILKKYTLLLWENHESPHVLPIEKRLTIDDDLCVITNDFEV